MACELIEKILAIESALVALRDKCAQSFTLPESRECAVPYLLTMIQAATAIRDGGYGVTESVSRPDVPACVTGAFLVGVKEWIEGMTCGFDFDFSEIYLAPRTGYIKDGSAEEYGGQGAPGRVTITVNGTKILDDQPWYARVDIGGSWELVPANLWTQFHELIVEGNNSIVLTLNQEDKEYTDTFGVVHCGFTLAWIKLEGENSILWTGQTNWNSGYSAIGEIPDWADKGVVTQVDEYTQRWDFTVLPANVARKE